MIPAGSRYEDAERIFAQAHVYSAFGYPFLEGEAPNLKVKIVNRETSYRLVAGAAPEDPQEYYVKESETMQWLAHKFLADARRWWELADANPHVWYPLDLYVGSYIKIPATT